MNALRTFRVYLRMALPLHVLVKLPFHGDHEICANGDCPLCFVRPLW